MKKYFLPLAALVAFLATSGLNAADFGDLLTRLDSRDFSAEKDVLSGQGGPFVGETSNPHADTPMFKARDQFSAMITDAIGNDEKTADLRAFVFDAVKQDVSVETKVWLIQELGYFGIDEDVPALVELLKNDEQRIVDAAAVALAKIPGDAARKALEENQTIPAAAAALSSIAQPIPPIEPLENSMPLALSHAPQEAVDEYLTQYDQFTDAEKVRALASLIARDDKQYRDLALEAMKSDSPELRYEGFLAMEKMATAEDAELFLSHLTDYPEVTQWIGKFIVADGFDDALRAELAKTTDTKRFLDIATLLINRFVDIRADVYRRTTAKECPDRLILLQQVANVSTAEDVPSMVASTLLIPRGKDHDAAENLVANLCQGDATPLIELINDKKYPASAIYPMMCRTGGEAAKVELTRGLDSKDQNLHNAAMRALPMWADGAFADRMWKMLSGNELSEAQFTPILRAYIRVISLPDDKIGIEMTRDQKLEALKKAYQLAKRPDEKRLILDRLEANRTIDFLRFAVECAGDPEVAEAAYKAIADHAHDTAIRKQYPDIVLDAINLVIEKSEDKALIERVEIYKGRMEQNDVN